jgi:hypothetical protein
VKSNPELNEQLFFISTRNKGKNAKIGIENVTKSIDY